MKQQYFIQSCNFSFYEPKLRKTPKSYEQYLKSAIRANVKNGILQKSKFSAVNVKELNNLIGEVVICFGDQSLYKYIPNFEGKYAIDVGLIKLKFYINHDGSFLTQEDYDNNYEKNSYISYRCQRYRLSSVYSEAKAWCNCYQTKIFNMNAIIACTCP
jgi:hypothetical protein